MGNAREVVSRRPHPVCSLAPPLHNAFRPQKIGIRRNAQRCVEANKMARRLRTVCMRDTLWT